MTTKATTVQTAQRVRQDLKAAFPNVKFTVRSRTRGTDAIDVEWEDGPTTNRVNSLVGGYQHGEFDGMTDSYNYRGGKVVGGVEHGVRWMQTQRHMSDAAGTRFEALIREYRGDLEDKRDYEISNLAWREFVKWDGVESPLPATTDDLPSVREYHNWKKGMSHD